MICPKCQADDTKVIDSRGAQNGKAVRRRRQCVKCNFRFTTFEYVEVQALLVVKSDKRRVPLDRGKILKSLVIACNKRPVSYDVLMQTTNDIIASLNDKSTYEIKTEVIGEVVMEALKKIDEIAYVRFASVYRKFKDITEFKAELEDL
jgi:transcriptional repressor NrdR